MTHKTIKLIATASASRANSLQVKRIVTDGGEAHFVVGEWLWSREFEKCEPGDHVVTFRVNPSARKQVRRFVMGVERYTGEAVEVVEAPTAAASSPVRTEKVEPYFHVEPAHYDVFNTATAMLGLDGTKPVRVLMVGPSGYGKTTLPQKYAAARGMGYFRMNCASVRDPEEWFGYREARDGTTEFVPSEFIKRVVAGNCVVVLDEFNRLEQWLSNTLYPLLDDDAATTINNQVFRVGPNVLFVMTINLGFQFTGTFTLDAALTNRVDMFCEVGPLPPAIEARVLVSNDGVSEADAAVIVEVAGLIRKIGGVECSTRTTRQVARLVVAGSTVRAAFQHAVVMRCRADANLADQAKQVVDLVNSKLGPYRPPSPRSGADFSDIF